jgi:hypothetical protein
MILLTILVIVLTQAIPALAILLVIQFFLWQGRRHQRRLATPQRVTPHVTPSTCPWVAQYTPLDGR